ncbi:hypothetical protein BS78_04G206300 [Paspalum vaginatum]|nr:hypothetical protein BS78_04G206300 [Paspalum vaginatum]
MHLIWGREAQARRRLVPGASVAGHKSNGARRAREDPAAELVTVSPSSRSPVAGEGTVVLCRLHRLVTAEVSPRRAFFAATIPGEPRFGFDADLAEGADQRPVS